MATKPLRSIKFPGLTDTYTVAATDTTLTIAGEPVFINGEDLLII